MKLFLKDGKGPSPEVINLFDLDENVMDKVKKEAEEYGNLLDAITLNVNRALNAFQLSVIAGRNENFEDSLYICEYAIKRLHRLTYFMGNFIEDQGLCFIPYRTSQLFTLVPGKDEIAIVTLQRAALEAMDSENRESLLSGISSFNKSLYSSKVKVKRILINYFPKTLADSDTYQPLLKEFSDNINPNYCNYFFDQAHSCLEMMNQVFFTYQVAEELLISMV